MSYSDNVLSYSRGALLREIRMNRFLPTYAVTADALTGDWKDDPVSKHEFVTSLTWSQKEDTRTESHLLYDMDGTTVALLVEWIHPWPNI